jgi:hypothetical protein
MAASCEHGEEPSGSIKDREFLDSLSIYYLLKKHSVHEDSYDFYTDNLGIKKLETGCHFLFQKLSASDVM